VCRRSLKELLTESLSIRAKHYLNSAIFGEEEETVLELSRVARFREKSACAGWKS
jgi:hypothetical protein